MTTDPYNLALQFLSRGKRNWSINDSTAEKLIAAQRDRVAPKWFIKTSVDCPRCHVVRDNHDNSTTIRSPRAPASSDRPHLLRIPSDQISSRGYRGILRFVVTADSVAIDRRYFKDRLKPLSDPTKWQGQEQLLEKVTFREAADMKVLRGLDDVIRFTAYISNDKLAPPIITQRRVEMGGAVALETAKSFLDTCLREHPLCQVQNPPLLPTRVLDVGESDGSLDLFIKLHTSSHGERGNYAALSYCWGGRQAIVTTSLNLEAHTKSLDLSQCSQTIKDAVFVARGLHIRYLWIDALCILQDETKDKLDEIERMGMIFKNATVTIAAANSSSAEHGFLEIRPKRQAAIGRALSHLEGDQEISDHPNTRIWLDREPEHDHAKEPLSLRGWAFQEQILSQRLLQYGSKGVTWHCLDADKTVPILHHYVQYKPRSKASRPAILQRAASVQGKIGFQLWNEMIEDYSNRELTFAGDRLLAIAGIASELHAFFKDTYLAGLWKEDLVQQLGWRQVENHHASSSPYILSRTAPSWSWASVDGAVKFGALYAVPDRPPPTAIIRDAEVVNCWVEPKVSSAPFGDVMSGCLTLSAKIFEGPHPSSLDAVTLDEVHNELGISTEGIFGTRYPRWNDTLEVTIDQNASFGAQYLSVDSRRVVSPRCKKQPRAWYLLLGHCFNRSPVGLILVPIKSGVFRRIGYFQSKDPYDPPVAFNTFVGSVARRETHIT